MIGVRTLYALVSIAVAVAVLMAVRGGSAAQETPTVTITTVDATDYPRITAVVATTDGNGVPIGNLSAEDFQAFEEETQLTVSGFQTERLALSVVLVIDVSGSMEGAPLASAKDAAREFVQNLGAEDTAAIVAFSSAVTQVTPFTADKAALTGAIDALVAAGDTALFDAAQAGVNTLSTAAAPRKAMVLLSDGLDTTSAATADGSLTAARDAQIPVYSIGFGPQVDTTYLQSLAGATGGQYRAADIGSVAAVYGDIARVLNSVYTLTLMSPEEESRGGESTLRIVADISGVAAEGTAAFALPDPPVPTPVTEPTAAVADDGSSNTPLLVVGGLAGAGALGVVALGAAAVYRRARTRRHQLAVVALNPETAAAQPLPHAPGVITFEGEHGVGRLISLDEEGTFEFGATPLVIGSAHDCQVRLPRAPDVAPKHASVWMRDGKIMLRHTGGGTRPTLVAGYPVDWVILEPGDEFAVGIYRYRVELGGSAA